MSRQLSSAALQSLFAQSTDQIWLTLVDIDHPELPSTLRFVDNTESLIVGVTTYVGVAFRFDLPADAEGAVKEARITIDNVGRQVVEVIRSITTPPTITIRIVRAAAPSEPELGPLSFTLRNVDYNAHSVSGRLTDDDDGQNIVPYIAYSPHDMPGLY